MDCTIVILMGSSEKRRKKEERSQWRKAKEMRGFDCRLISR
jgi:hypothetical protein